MSEEKKESVQTEALVKVLPIMDAVVSVKSKDKDGVESEISKVFILLLPNGCNVDEIDVAIKILSDKVVDLKKQIKEDEEKKKAESVTPESVTPESVTPESVTPESVTPESVTQEVKK